MRVSWPGRPRLSKKKNISCLNCNWSMSKRKISDGNLMLWHVARTELFLFQPFLACKNQKLDNICFLQDFFRKVTLFEASKHVLRTLIKMVPAFFVNIMYMFRFTTTKTRLQTHSFGTCKFDVKFYLIWLEVALSYWLHLCERRPWAPRWNRNWCLNTI